MSDSVKECCGQILGHTRWCRRIQRPLKVYIAGKITGLDELTAKKLFAAGSMFVEVSGHMPRNPIELVDQSPGRPYADMLRDAIKVLMDCDAVYFLPNWRESKGACIEREIAQGLGMLQIYDEPGSVAKYAFCDTCDSGAVTRLKRVCVDHFLQHFNVSGEVRYLKARC